ncbi:MAG: hypothetical protein P8R42_05385 [Candidatus Binatia bacterium]|nr:hypothetical protein [Candidatus Binatia bacterium]
MRTLDYFGRFTCGALLLFVIACSPPPPEAPAPRKIPSQDVGSRALFGFKVALSKDLIAVGAPHARANDHRKAGAVLLFDRKTLALVRKVESPDPSEGALFGFAIALRGDRLLVGSAGRTVDGVPVAGAAYLINVRTGLSVRRFVESPPHAKAEFGSAVGFIGEDPVIGSPSSDVQGHVNAGIAYRFSANTGELLLSYHLPTPEDHMALGQVLTASGDTLLLGGPAAMMDGVAHAGAAFAFDANTGALKRRLLEPAAGEGSSFGASLATDGKFVVIGAPNANHRAGRAYVLDLASGKVVAALHDTANLEDGAMFGYSLALTDDGIIVGAPHDTVKGIPGAGAVYYFDRATRKFVARLAVRPVGGADFGIDVAGAGSEYVTGAQRGPKGGTAYISEDAPKEVP